MKSTNCLACNKIFVPKWYGRDKACSYKCRNILISKSKIKYTPNQIDQVIKLKKNGETNLNIKKITGVKLSKIKEIVKKHNLFLDKIIKNKNAYEGKLIKNPNAMQDMRKKYHNIVCSEESLDEVKEILKTRGYEYIDGFESKTKSFIVKCLKCKKNKRVSRIYTIIKDSCIYCSGSTRTSKIEKEIQSWINSLGLSTEKFKFKKRKNGDEIDIYIPSLKIGIEYCGLYWHNENSPTPRKRLYHYNKMIKANENGIRLITIFGDEWKDRNIQVKNFIKSTLKIYNHRIFARKCYCKIIPKEIAKKFLNETHIQGSGQIVISFGLFFDDTLVGVMTGSYHHRNKNSKELILNRLAFKDGYQVIGGSSKLLTNIIKYAESKKYSKIISWSDNRWSEGNVYFKMNFYMNEELKPDYSYAHNQQRLSKQSCKKSHLIKKGAIGKTELELANSLGYKRIWDCGKKRWVYNL